MGSLEFFNKYVRKTFLICLSVFILLGIGGYILFIFNMESAEQIFAEIEQVFGEKDVMGEDGKISWIMLFWNNLRASGTAFLLGAIPFMFLPAAALLVNGGLIGVVFAIISSYAPGSELSYFAAGLLPHGIFEVPAICLGISLGIVLCLFECQKILDKGKMADCDAIDFVGNLCKLFVLAGIPLLVIAALIESYITPMLMNLVI